MTANRSPHARNGNAFPRRSQRYRPSRARVRRTRDECATLANGHRAAGDAGRRQRSCIEGSCDVSRAEFFRGRRMIVAARAARPPLRGLDDRRGFLARRASDVRRTVTSSCSPARPETATRRADACTRRRAVRGTTLGSPLPAARRALLATRAARPTANRRRAPVGATGTAGSATTLPAMPRAERSLSRELNVALHAPAAPGSSRGHLGRAARWREGFTTAPGVRTVTQLTRRVKRTTRLCACRRSL